MKKYSAVIVLAAGVRQNDEGPRRFEQDGERFAYEIKGDPYEFRFKAVKKLFTTGASSNFIVVGGDVETTKDGKKDKYKGQSGEVVSKSKVMADCLINYYQIPADKIVVLHSESNTKGNAVEVARYFSENKTQSLDQVGLLTSFFHLPRSIRTFADVGNLRLIPISAEGVIYEEEFENIHQFYSEEGFSMILGDIQDQPSEIKGMGDQEKGSYTPMFY